MLNLNFHAKLKIKKSAFGNRLQDYEILEPLGKGGFSDVYKAKCYRNNTYTAIKMIRKDVIQKEGLFERISQEINIQSELEHPSILKLLTAFDDADFVYIVLELCSKGELMKYVNKDGKRTLSEKEARIVMLQIIDGLKYLHSKNILHRDIKLANILLTENMQIKIADFGLATRILYPGECHTTMCGTPNYISPEIVSRKIQGPEVDLWSLGCLFYTLLVGRPPFETNTVKNTLNRVVAGDYWMPINLSLSAQDLIKRLLQKNPQHRMNLEEIRNHHFMLDDCAVNSSKWISNDSGFDTNTGSLDYISSRFHSLDRKYSSGNSNGYYSFETPKSLRRSRSQDGKKTKDRFDVYQKDAIVPLKEVEVEFFPLDCEKVENDRKYCHTNIYQLKAPYAKNPVNKEFCPVQRCASHEKENCEIFDENEIFNQKSSGHLKREYVESCEYLQSTPVLSKQNEIKALRCRVGEDVSSRKFDCFIEGKIRDSKTVTRECILGALSSESDYSEGRIKVLPFNTERLKPTRHRLRNAIFSILENGDVCIELLRNKSKLKEMVVEVIRISKNGLKMYIYYPNKGRGVFPTNSPPPLPLQGADAVFNCEALSKENWKKYSYAARFVEMVQSKTPKLTLYTNKARCVLMENKPEPDFEIIYYDGAKITKSRKGIKLTDNNGVISVLDDTGQEYLDNVELTEHYKYFRQCYDYCRLIELQLANVCSSDSETIFKVFPAILGKKPDSRNDLNWNSVHSPNIFHSTKYPA